MLGDWTGLGDGWYSKTVMTARAPAVLINRACICKGTTRKSTHRCARLTCITSITCLTCITCITFIQHFHLLHNFVNSAATQVKWGSLVKIRNKGNWEPVSVHLVWELVFGLSWRLGLRLNNQQTKLQSRLELRAIQVDFDFETQRPLLE